MHARLFFSLSLFLLVLAAAPATALGGPPWISIEVPANPFDRTTRESFFVVRTYRHGNPIALQVTGTMEGFVDGKRVSRALRFERTPTAGLTALVTEIPSDGTWVLVVVGGEGDWSATALVDIREGRVQGIEVPRSGLPFRGPRKLEPGEVDARLRALAAGEAPLLAKPGVDPVVVVLLGAAAGLLPIGAFAFRRVRRRQG